MADLQTRKSELEEFLKEYAHRNRQAEENRQRENQAATTIQSWFRSCKVRVYISYLHRKAIIIQAMWRGFTARARVRQMVKEAYFIMKMNFYQEMAVRIQRRWRGFIARKYIHNFYARKQYLEGLAEQNNLRRRELDEFEELQRRERHCMKMVKEQTARVHKAHRLHHLLSTEQSAGIYNSPFRSAPHEMELLMRQVKYRVPAKIASRGRNNLVGCPNPMATVPFPGTGIRSTRNCYSRPILPHIGSKEQQVVFRQPGEWWEQRMHCPELMWPLQTSYTQLKEVRSQLKQYEPLRLPSLSHCDYSHAHTHTATVTNQQYTTKHLPVNCSKAFYE